VSTLREPGVIEKRVIRSKGDLLLVVRRLVWNGKECVDVRFAEIVGWRRTKYTRSGVRVSLEVAKSLMLALMDVLGTEVEVEKAKARRVVEEEVEAWPPIE